MCATCASSGLVDLRSLVIELQNFNCICAAVFLLFSIFFRVHFRKLYVSLVFKPFSLVSDRTSSVFVFVFWVFGFRFSLCLLNMYFRFARLDSIQDKEEKRRKRNTSAADIYIVACIAHGVHRK